ncbi:MAG: HDOD domain-containing protein [Candidatus Hydrogenedentes bacterium]|nr:HDOD domain-containing protein [Candidatus Hydrogenedentota bacterium]
MGLEVKVERDRIADMLAEAGLVAAEDLKEALSEHRRSGEPVVNILISQGALDSRAFVSFLAESDQFESPELQIFDIAPEIIELVPKKFALMNELVPICRRGSELTLATIQLPDIAVIKALEERTGLTVKPLVCSAEDVRSSLERHYENESAATGKVSTLEAPIKLTSVATLIHQIDSLPALPGTIHKVREILHDMDASSADAGDIIAQDPAIAAKVLKVANSAAYGFSHQVDGLQLAVSLLGLVETYSVVISSAVLDIFDRSRTFDYVAFWLQSTACAGLAKALMPLINQKSRSGVFTAGLLHDIGRVALVQVAPRQYKTVKAGLVGAQLIAEEERVLGFSHTEAGAQLARLWDLPVELAECIRFHHTPHYASDEHRLIVSVINVAEVAARAHREDAGSGGIDFTECAESLNFLNISEDQVIEVFNSVPKPSASDSLWVPR